MDINDMEKIEEIIGKITEGGSTKIPEGVNVREQMSHFKMRLYGLDYEIANQVFFETEEDLENFCRSNGISIIPSRTFFLDFFRMIGNYNDVIRKTYKDGRSYLYRIVSTEEYAVRDITKGYYVEPYVKYSADGGWHIEKGNWKYYIGDIRKLYTPFIDRGIILENNVYGKTDIGSSSGVMKK